MTAPKCTWSEALHSRLVKKSVCTLSALLSASQLHEFAYIHEMSKEISILLAILNLIKENCLMDFLFVDVTEGCL